MPDQAKSDNPIGAFGPNEWLVDELYEQWLADKDSVDRAWWEFFEDYKPGHPSGALSSNGAAAAPVSAPAPAPAIPVTQPSRESATPAAWPARVARLAWSARDPRQQPRLPRCRGTSPPKSTPPPSEAEVRPLRGPAARVVANMQSSLEVPTATSVRSVPAKLLIDNRVVINNHLARSRGGKVSFTHIIGFALVKALKALPEMNHAFGEQVGKPVVIAPAHINLGLAIDLAKPDGTRQLLVPSIKSAELMDFVHFWSVYEGHGEEGPRRQADRGRLSPGRRSR